MYKNKIIAIITNVMPNNCGECVASEGKCSLPMKVYPNHDKMKKQFLKKRHKECPLRVEDN